MTASPAAVVPFARALPLELHGEIALHLDRNSLESYSLASRALNKESNRILWRSVAVTPPRGIHDGFAEALLRDPDRAANIREIKFVSKGSAYHGLSIFSFATGSTWKPLEEALNLLVSVSSVKIIAPHKFDGTNSTFPDRFIDIIGRVFQEFSVSELFADISLDALFSLCQSWPSLTYLPAETEFWPCPIDPRQTHSHNFAK